MKSLPLPPSSLSPLPPYQVGGSLSPDRPSYVYRQADAQLYQALIAGEFCYVLNSRQMGKSSLMVHTLRRLETEGYRCATLDITSLGSHQVTAAQWYRGVVADLWRGFGLVGQFDYKTWWQNQGDVPPVQKLHGFLREGLLEPCPDQTFIIFIDEIDSILGVDFSLDDFFALIRFCYNQRAVDPRYRRITFAIFGVATPADLIQDRQRTPFNIGQAIPLNGFEGSECGPLLAGLEPAITQAEAILQAILDWTGGQPFLTQKLCAYIWQLHADQGSQIAVPAGQEADWVRQRVLDHIINHWETQDEPEHLRTIRDRLLRHTDGMGRVLGQYQRILQQGQVPLDQSAEETELLLSGLVVKAEGHLRVKNAIYSAIFDEAWVAHHLNHWRPYSQAIQAWIDSQRTDASRLLRGQALQDAQDWAQGKRLSDDDYQFLAASVEFDRQAMRLALAAERSQAMAAQLQQAQRVTHLQRWLLGTLGIGFVLASGLGSLAWYQSGRASQSEQMARSSEVKALSASAEGWFDSKNRLDALLQAIRAQRQLARLRQPDPALQAEVERVLKKIILGINEVNRFSGHSGEIRAVAYSPDGSQIASTSKDNTIKLWNPDGSLGHTLATPDDSEADQEALSIAYSPTGDQLAAGYVNGAIKLWDTSSGDLLETWETGANRVLSLAFSPDGERVAAGDIRGNLQLWRRDGTLLHHIKAHDAMIRTVAFSPDGEVLVSGSADQTLKVWHPTEGRLLNTLSGHRATVAHVTFSPDGDQMASASSDKTIVLWDRAGQIITRLEGHQSSVTHVRYLADGQRLVSTSLDHEVRFWQRNGESLPAYEGIAAAGRSIDLSPDGEFMVSSGLPDNHEAILWRIASPFYNVIGSHDAPIIGVAHSPTADLLASSGVDGQVKLWQTDGTPLAAIPAHRAPAIDVVFSPDGQILSSASMDGTIRLWQPDGTPLLTYPGHQPNVARVTFSPDGQTIASAGMQSNLQVWQLDGQDRQPSGADRLGISSLVWHPQRSLLAYSNADNAIQFLDPATNSLQQTLVGHTAHIRDLAFDAEGRYLASASEDRTVRLWDADRGEEVAVLEGHTDIIWDVTFAPPAADAILGVPFLASAGGDKSIRLWTLTGDPIAILDKHNAAVYRLSFSPDGRWLFSASADERLIRWDLEAVMTVDPLAYACDWVQDYLTHHPDLSDDIRQVCD
ncbi:MAG: AAA-like domain-containing protein [Spirulina sp.]